MKVYLCRTCPDLVTTGFKHIGNMALWVSKPIFAHENCREFMRIYWNPEDGLLRNSLQPGTIINKEIYGYRFKKRRLVGIPSEKRVLEKLNKLRKLGIGSETILKAPEKLDH